MGIGPYGVGFGGFADGRVENPPAKIAASVGQGYGLAAPEVNKGSAGYFVCAE